MRVIPLEGGWRPQVRMVAWWWWGREACLALAAHATSHASINHAATVALMVVVHVRGVAHTGAS